MIARGAGLLARLRPPPALVAAVITGLALVVLIPAAVSSTPVMIAVFFALVLFLGLVILGFGHTSEFFVILGVCLVPMTNLHPVDAVSFITLADAAFAVGFGLMLPDLMRRPLHLPSIFVLGVAGVLTVALFSSLLADDPDGELQLPGQVARRSIRVVDHPHHLVESRPDQGRDPGRAPMCSATSSAWPTA